MARREPVAVFGRNRRQVDELLGDEVPRRGAHRRGGGGELLIARCRPDHQPVAPRAVDRLHHQLVDPLDRLGELIGILEAVGVDVGEDRLLGEVVGDERRHVGVDQLVVSDAIADGVRDRDVAGARRVDEAGAADEGLGAEVHRVEELVVHAAIDDVDATLAGGHPHVDDVVADDEVSPLDELDAHLAGEEGVLEVGRVVHSGGEDDDGRLGTGAMRRRRAQRRQQTLGVVGDRADAVAGEQLGEDPRHRAPVLDDVGAPRGHTDVVLEDAKGALPVADEIDPRDVDAHLVRGLDAGTRPLEVARGHDEMAGDDPVGEDLAAAVDVAQELARARTCWMPPRPRSSPTPRRR